MTADYARLGGSRTSKISTSSYRSDQSFHGARDAAEDSANYTLPSGKFTAVTVNTASHNRRGLIDVGGGENCDSSASQTPELHLDSDGNKLMPAPWTPPPLLKRSSSFSVVIGYVGDRFQPGGLKGSIFTMIICIVGAGCLSLPYAIREAGFIVGIGLLFFGAVLALFTLDLLLIAAEYLPEHLRGRKPYRNISYRTLAQYSYGKRLATGIQVLMCVQYFGSMVAYVVAFSGLIDLVWQIYNSESIYIPVAVGVGVVIIFPLSLLRSVSSLRFTSLLGFACSAYLALIVMVEYFALCSTKNVRDGDHSTTCLWSINKGFYFTNHEIFPLNSFSNAYKGLLTAIPLNIFAYTGHPFLLPLYVELQRPTITRMRKVFRRGIGVCLVIYLCVGVFGYLLFLDETCGNLLTNDFHTGIQVIIAAIGISISCILTEPIFSYNFRRMFARLVWNISSKDLSSFKHIAITVVFVGANIILGITVTSISQVFGFLGSTTYPILGYILPAVFFCKMVPSGKYRCRKILAVAQAVFVAIISICSLIYKIHSPGDLKCANVQTIGT